jgi:hypothetical protein
MENWNLQARGDLGLQMNYAFAFIVISFQRKDTGTRFRSLTDHYWQRHLLAIFGWWKPIRSIFMAFTVFVRHVGKVGHFIVRDTLSMNRFVTTFL